MLRNADFRALWLGYWPGRSEVPTAEFIEAMKAYMMEHWPTEDAEDVFSPHNTVFIMRELESFPPTQQVPTRIVLYFASTSLRTLCSRRRSQWWRCRALCQ